MNLLQKLGLTLTFLIICLGIGVCCAEENPGSLMYLQGGSSTLSVGSNETMTLTISDVIPYYDINVENRSYLMPMEEKSLYLLPLTTALVLNGPDGELVYFVTIESWSFDTEKTNLTLEIKPLEYYEGKELKRFTPTKQDLSVEAVGKEQSTGVYIDVVAITPSNFEYQECCVACMIREHYSNAEGACKSGRTRCTRECM